MKTLADYVGTVLTFKINSGEELIAKVVRAVPGGQFIEVSDPVSIAPSQHGMGLVPSAFTIDTAEPIRLNTNCVTLYGVTEEAVRLKYIEAVTGIKTPAPKKIILG